MAFGSLETRYIVASFVGGAALLVILVLLVVWFCIKLRQRGVVGDGDVEAAATPPSKTKKSSKKGGDADADKGGDAKISADEALSSAAATATAAMGSGRHRVKPHHHQSHAIEVLDADPFNNNAVKANPLFSAFESPAPRSTSVSSPLAPEFGFGDLASGPDAAVTDQPPLPPPAAPVFAPADDAAKDMPRHTSFKALAAEAVAVVHAAHLATPIAAQAGATTPRATTPTPPDATVATVAAVAAVAAVAGDASAAPVDARQARIVAMREARERKKREEEDLLMQALTILDNLIE